MLDWYERQYQLGHVKAVAKTGPDAGKSFSGLIKLLDERDPRLSAAASAALVQMGPAAKPAVPTLIKLVKEKGVRTRPACMTLGKLGTTAKEAIPAIAELLQDEVYTRTAFEALCEFGPDASPLLPRLVKVVRARDLSDSATNNVLSRPNCIRFVIELTHDRSPARRADAQRLWKVIGPEDSRFLVLLLRSEDTRVHDLIVDKLCGLGPAVVPEVAGLLKDNDVDLRQIAVRTLGRIGPAAKDAVPALAALLHDKDWETRSAAAIVLGQIGADGEASVAALTESLSDMQGDVRVCAIEALSRIGPAAAPATAGLTARLGDTSPAVRSAAARALGQIGPAARKALPALDKLRSDREDYVRQAAGDACRAIAADDRKQP
jgi:HEAT repeat protein